MVGREVLGKIREEAGRLIEILRRFPGGIEESHENLSRKTVFLSLFLLSKSQAHIQRLTTTLTSSAIQFDVLCEPESPTPRTKRSESQYVKSSSSSEIKNSPKWISIIPTCLRDVIRRQ
jgi:hypothetical protein